MYHTAGASTPQPWNRKPGRAGAESAGFVGHRWEVKVGVDAICSVLSHEHLLNVAGLQSSKCHRGKMPRAHRLLVSNGAAALFQWSCAGFLRLTTWCHVFPVSIVACLHLWGQFRLSKGSLKVVLCSSLFIVFAVSLKVRLPQTKSVIFIAIRTTALDFDVLKIWSRTAEISLLDSTSGQSFGFWSIIYRAVQETFLLFCFVFQLFPFFVLNLSMFGV